ncbi:MAG: cysteine--tRNA ligase [Candidatus Colwellbacteria bacterium]|nr:cysteine--tRNA ligase [Candidatus Colwellbacteria bacterium]
MLALYNTLTRRKEKFKPEKSNSVNLYTCGPTVYDRVHIGNLRTFIFEDILRRTLRYNGYKVRQVMNITDIEDKIISRFKKEKRRSITAITNPYTNQFFEDIERLNIEKAESYPLVTTNIQEITGLIKKLLSKKIAYQGKDGSIYFDISKFKEYGKLSRLPRGKLKPGIRISADEYGKGEAADFVLWKARKPGEPYWRSPFGEGRPGWHIECSALSLKYLKGIDIHTGGVDLIFPHHENEIAQSEAATGKKFVNYWLHGEHLLVNGRKMSKSLKNFYTLKDLEKKKFDPLSFRYLILNAHYRSKLNFTWRAVEAAEQGLTALYRETARLSVQLNSVIPSVTPQDLQILTYKDDFYGAINDDLNTPKALAIVWDLVRNEAIWPKNKLALLLDFDQVLGLKLKEAVDLAKPPRRIDALIKERERYRTNKQFVQADQLRKKIEALGYTVEDTPQGPFVWRQKT